MDSDFEIYDGKSFSDLCKSIVDNQEEMKGQIDILVSELKPLIKTVNDAMIVVPLLKEYIDVGVKNNEHLIKLAAITNKIKSKYPDIDPTLGSGFDGILSDEEKAEIAKHVGQIQSEQKKVHLRMEKKETLED